ncbi:hypothetical protein C8J56DRAFT_1063675 [Mycena floridula]|nr:hypothetical protein C8J56DRAFT_1063675 [Mycena floridula]
MSRRPHSSTPSPRINKRARLDHLTSEDFKNRVFLAPMVRSVPTRLFALKRGTSLIWGPEIVDKAILHSERIVDRPYIRDNIIHGQIESHILVPSHRKTISHLPCSSDPETTVQAAKTVMNDVSGIDLNCGCPKLFSTHSGMGAALLTNPDLLRYIEGSEGSYAPRNHCDGQNQALAVPGGYTEACGKDRDHLRDMRDKDHARIDRLRKIVDFVEGMGRGIAVVENGDCARSVMIARAAEANPSRFFSDAPPGPRADTHPARYCQNHWALTKFCTAAFKGSHSTQTKKDQIAVRQRTSIAAKGFDELEYMVRSWTGAEEIAKASAARPPRISLEATEIIPDNIPVALPQPLAV